MTSPHEHLLAELDTYEARAQELCPPLAVALSVMLAAHYAGREEEFEKWCRVFGEELKREIGDSDE